MMILQSVPELQKHNVYIYTKQDEFCLQSLINCIEIICNM